MKQSILFVAVFILAVVLTGVVRKIALRRNLMDVPNERSSHKVPTPRGGGLSIVGIVVVAWLIVMSFGDVSRSLLTPLLLGGLAVAVVGYVDDRAHVPARARFAVHVASASLVVLLLGGVGTISYPGGAIDLGFFGQVVAVLYVAWLLNLYNFMDGIDGIAGIEAITVAAAAAGLLLNEEETGLAVMTACIAVSSAGFLVWNWAPARIFMGDVGSGFLGFCFGGLAVVSHVTGALDIYVWSILLGTFIVDATFTLLKRILTRQRFYEAHRSHAYQHAAIRYSSHGRISLAVGALNLLWLLPIAFLVAAGHVHGLYGLLIAYAPLVAVAWAFGAGKAAGETSA
jgi:Fuc2NAc and GlcNAc transferase